MHFLETAVEIAREAGALVANYHQRHVPFETKGEFDLVTEADRASEKLIVERLRSHFPAHAIVAEEGGGHESVVGIPLVRGSRSTAPPTSRTAFRCFASAWGWSARANRSPAWFTTRSTANCLPPSAGPARS
jgi:3'-phosphoadenosine 5'-phosphosulfate (PAPS) 3'-phosphatase